MEGWDAAHPYFANAATLLIYFCYKAFWKRGAHLRCRSRCATVDDVV